MGTIVPENPLKSKTTPVTKDWDENNRMLIPPSDHTTPMTAIVTKESKPLSMPAQTLGGVAMHKKYRPGKYFEHDTRETFKYYQDQTHGSLYFFRLYDWYDFQRKLPPKKQPADFFMIYKGTSYLVECKSSQLTSFPLENIAGHQIESLLSYQRAGGIGLFLIQHLTDTLKEVYAITVDQLVKARSDMLKIGRKSIRWEELDKYGIKLPQIKTHIWGLGVILPVEGQAAHS